MAYTIDMNEMQRATSYTYSIETGMQKAYVIILHRIIKNSIKNKFVLAEADRILEESNTAYDRAKAKAMEM
jgi:hypothetical protein